MKNLKSSIKKLIINWNIGDCCKQYQSTRIEQGNRNKEMKILKISCLYKFSILKREFYFYNETNFCLTISWVFFISSFYILICTITIQVILPIYLKENGNFQDAC